MSRRDLNGASTEVHFRGVVRHDRNTTIDERMYRILSLVLLEVTVPTALSSKACKPKKYLLYSEDHQDAQQ